MIQATKLLEAIRNRTCNWELIEIYPNAEMAKKSAAKMFINSQGVKVKQYREQGWVVLAWRVKGDL